MIDVQGLKFYFEPLLKELETDGIDFKNEWGVLIFSHGLRLHS